MSEANRDKSRGGYSFREEVSLTLQQCKEFGYIDECVSHSVGMKGFAADQFSVPFKIRFSDSTEWIIFTTKTVRKDRIKENNWDAEKIKQLSPEVTRAYLIYPDNLSEKELRNASSINMKIQSKIEYSPLDSIISRKELSGVIRDYFFELNNQGIGGQKDKIGNDFEKQVAGILSNLSNLEKWKKNDEIAAGFYYDIFDGIVTAFGLDSSQIANIEATSDKKVIQTLPQGGPAKTDVIVTVTYDSGDKKNFTISCKRTSQKSVSVQQASADTMANVLDRSNDKLRRALNAFQTAGSKRGMDADDAETLEKEIAPYRFRLCEWAISGKWGEVKSSNQIADYLLVYDENSGRCAIHKAYSYCHKLMENCSRAFGTPFQWTYPSKQLGRYIQLKCPIDL